MVRFPRRVLDAVARRVADQVASAPGSSSQAVQRLVLGRYRKTPGRSFADVGFRVTSQSDEDGILLYLFAHLGMRTRRCIEIGVGLPTSSNTTNLITNWGWSGLLLDGDEALVEGARAWFARHPDTAIHGPAFVSSWLDSENINAVVSGAGWHGEIDLLSIDIDGIDYWIWEALDVVAPRVAVVEYNDMWPADRSVTVPHDARFTQRRALDTEYSGASLAAMTKLAERKGYRLVGCNRLGYNAFFLHTSEGHEAEIPTVTVEACLNQPKTLAERPRRLPLMQQFDWIEV